MACVTNRLLVLDTASLYYRAYYGLPDNLRAPDGIVVNALRGTLDFVSLLVQEHRPDAIIAAWDDDWRPQWRVELLHTYKTHRLAPGSSSDEDTPEDLALQVPLIREALDLLHIPVLGFDGAEADDVIGSFAAQSHGPVDVATGDRDLFQIVDDARRHRVLYTARGVKAHRVINEAVVRSEYGVPPSQYADFAAMRGDPSDGIPGVPGIGVKTAARLLADFGDLAGIRGAIDDGHSPITARNRRNLQDAAAYLDAAQQVIRVRHDLPVPPVQAREPSQPPDTDAFERFADRYGLGSVATRAIAALA